MKQVGVSLATFVVWAAASSASAAAECSVGIVTANPEAGAISVPFDFFEATLDDPAACDLAVPSGVAPVPGTFSVYSADYRGFVSEGDQVELTVEQDGLIDGRSYPAHRMGSSSGTMSATSGRLNSTPTSCSRS
jgi:hypothetical protein